MQFDTVNKLYLELSQIATAKTAKEIALERKLAEPAVPVRELEAAIKEHLVHFPRRKAINVKYLEVLIAKHAESE